MLLEKDFNLLKLKDPHGWLISFTTINEKEKEEMKQRSFMVVSSLKFSTWVGEANIIFLFSSPLCGRGLR